MSGIAYYFDYNPVTKEPTDIKRPCYNKARNLFNPLATMEIAPTKYSGLKGGTFGNTRGREHKGLDLAAEIGTPIFAMIDGVISEKPYVTEQPNRIGKSGNYPMDYIGDKNGAGNRIYIEGTTTDGKVLKIGYWHLQAGNPVAINPRIGEKYKPGDKVYAGDLIGYTGKSGNANQTFKDHLHLYCTVNGQLTNPEEIINDKVNWQNQGNQKILLDSLIRNIICND